jgi:branched-subunit amino acid transport protein
MTENFFVYLLVIAGVTYLVRMLPMVLIKKKITNSFVRSFLYYVPYAVLGVMTVPAIFSSTSYLISAIVGFIVACILAYLEKSLVVVAASACGAVLICELIIKYFC